MPIYKPSISCTEARRIVAGIINAALQDGGLPVAVAVVDASARLIAFAAMDEVVPASIKLSQSKAYSAVIGQKDTKHWALLCKNPEAIGFDMRNWTDPDFSGFTGGIAINAENKIIGGVGVSGRKGEKGAGDELMQDNELANYGKTLLNFKDDDEL